MFLTLMVVGLIACILFVVLDGVLDAFDFGDGIISGIGISAGVAVFGAAGVFIESSSWNPEIGIKLLISVGAGLAVAAFAALITYRLRKSEVNDADITYAGSFGKVITRIKSDGAGEVMLDDSRVTDRYVATSAHNIEVGERVIVVRKESNSLRVAPVTEKEKK